MKVVRYSDVAARGSAVECPKGGFVSYRYLLAQDRMGFALAKTLIPRGDVQHWHYKNHLEACFCISGYGKLTNLDTGEVYEIGPDDCYVLDNHDDHTFQAATDVVLISVFNPPIRGNEVHKEDGSYE
jgi:L-ectoine synthase